MKSFKQYLNEAHISSQGSSTERHERQYVTPFIGRDEYSHTTNKDAGGIKAGSKVRIKKAERIGGSLHLHIEDEAGNTEKVLSSKVDKPKGVGRKAPSAEARAFAGLNSEIERARSESGVDELTLHTHHGEIKVSSAMQPSAKGSRAGQKAGRAPKADFVLQDSKGNDSYFISHKDGKHVTDFQQFGGVEDDLNHPEVRSFIDKVKNKYPNGVSGKTVGKKLDLSKPENSKFAHKALFGNMHGDENYGLNNVHAVLQGEIKLERHPSGEPGHYILKSSNTHPNIRGKNSIPDGMSMQLQARKAEGRGGSQGLENTRVTANPTNQRPTEDIDTGDKIK